MTANQICEVMTVYDVLSTVLDDIGITPLDFKKKMDYSNLLKVNRSRSQ